MKPRKLDLIKQRQLEEAGKTGVNPYDVATVATKATALPNAALGALAHYQAAIGADLARLAPIKDIVERAKLKKSMLETYLPFVDAYVANGDNYSNDVAVRVCIWLFDTLDIERGLNLAFVLIAQNQPTPDKFDRDLATFVCDAVYDWANLLLKEEQSASPYLDTLVAHIDNEQWSLSPPVQSKMYAMLAKHKNRVGEYQACIDLCDKALQVNKDGAGVKGLREGAVKALAKQTV